MEFKQIAFLASTILALAACQQESAPPASPQPSSNASAAQVFATKSGAAITVDPATMKSCADGVATVKWNAGKVGANSNSTEVWVGMSDTDTKLFSAGGAEGETKTGPWVRPGTHFLLKNKQDGKVLDEAIVGGAACH